MQRNRSRRNLIANTPCPSRSCTTRLTWRYACSFALISFFDREAVCLCLCLGPSRLIAVLVSWSMWSYRSVAVLSRRRTLSFSARLVPTWISTRILSTLFRGSARVSNWPNVYDMCLSMCTTFLLYFHCLCFATSMVLLHDALPLCVHSGSKAMCVQLHGDAAFAGQVCKPNAAADFLFCMPWSLSICFHLSSIDASSSTCMPWYLSLCCSTSLRLHWPIVTAHFVAVGCVHRVIDALPTRVL